MPSRGIRTNPGSYQSDGKCSLSWFLGLTQFFCASRALTLACQKGIVSYGLSGLLPPGEVSSPGAPRFIAWRQGGETLSLSLGRAFMKCSGESHTESEDTEVLFLRKQLYLCQHGLSGLRPKRMSPKCSGGRGEVVPFCTIFHLVSHIW